MSRLVSFILLQPKSLFWILVALAALANLSSWLWLYFKIPEEAYPFIIHYNIYFGRDLLGGRLDLFQAPFIGLIILIANSLLASSLWVKVKFFSWVVLGVTVSLQLFILFASGIIVYVNT